MLYSTKESTALERKSKETILDSGSISFAGYFLILDSKYYGAWLIIKILANGNTLKKQGFV